MTTPSEIAGWFECGWGGADHRLSGLMWETKPPEDYLRRVDYIRKRREIAAGREDKLRIAEGLDPLWNLK